MRKRDELAGPSCMTNALDAEMVFVLLARDAAAPHAIREWANKRVELGLSGIADGKIVEALACADTMEREHDEALRLAYIAKAPPGTVLEVITLPPADLIPPPSTIRIRESERDEYLADRFDTTDEHKGIK